MRRIATIIPFYQREPGILRKALMGILAQDLPADVRVHVFVIDDSSPLPAEGDLAELPLRPEVTLSVHRQPNAGPGGARNRGLDMAEAEGFDFIAFLDSDDIWQPPHLAEGLAALDRGYDFYFCDNAREGAHDSYSAEVPQLADKGARILGLAAEVWDEGLQKGFAPGALAPAMVSTCLCHTSTIVARSDALHGHRLDVDQRRACEDHLFWISVVLSDVAIAISWKCNVVCGRGVNIFYSAFDWNAAATLDRIGHTLLMFEKVRKWPKAMDSGGPAVAQSLVANRRAYGFLFIRTLLKGRRPSTESLRKLVRFDPLLPLRMPFLFLRLAFDKSPEARRF